MNCFRIVCVVLLASPLAFGQKQEVRELQRDVAMLQDQVRSLEKSLNESNARVTVLLQQAIDNINKLTTTVAVLDSQLRDREKNLAAPVTAVGAKVDQMASEFQGLRVTVDDLSSRLGKLQQQMVDLNNTIKVIQAPPTPPPAAPGSPSGAAGPPQGLSAEALYANGMRDKDSGNYDMALSEFNDYLKYYGGTEMAPNAQYYLGEIYYNRKDFENALQSFDMVLEKYPENNKTPDATYMKGRTLVQMGQRTKGAEQFAEVIKRWPRSDLASKAREQRKSLGLPANPAAPAAKRAAHRK
jgi:tol-pal system protein YbgF